MINLRILRRVIWRYLSPLARAVVDIPFVVLYVIAEIIMLPVSCILWVGRMLDMDIPASDSHWVWTVQWVICTFQEVWEEEARVEASLTEGVGDREILLRAAGADKEEG